MGMAETPHDRCVAGVAGGFQVVGDVAGGAGGAVLGSLVPLGQAGAVPLFAVVGADAVGEWMKSVGTKVGESFCP